MPFCNKAEAHSYYHKCTHIYKLSLTVPLNFQYQKGKLLTDDQCSSFMKFSKIWFIIIVHQKRLKNIL